MGALSLPLSLMDGRTASNWWLSRPFVHRQPRWNPVPDYSVRWSSLLVLAVSRGCWKYADLRAVSGARIGVDRCAPVTRLSSPIAEFPITRRRDLHRPSARVIRCKIRSSRAMSIGPSLQTRPMSFVHKRFAYMSQMDILSTTRLAVR